MRRFLPLLLVILAICCCGQPARAQNACSAGCNNWNGVAFQSGTTTPGATITGVTSGDSLHVYVCYSADATAVSSVTDNGTAMTIGSVIVNLDSGAFFCLVAARANVASGSHAIVANTSSAGSTVSVFVAEWPGNQPMVSQNGASDNATGVTSPQTGGNVTATGSALLESLYTNAGGAGAPTIPSGFTLAIPITAFAAGFTIAYENVSAGTFNPSWTPNAGGDDYPTVMNEVFQAGSSFPPQRSLTGVGK
jgi:hypothetical protein